MEDLLPVIKQSGELLTEKSLSDKDLLAEPYERKTERSHPIEEGDVTFSIGAETSFAIQLFNSADDKDDDGITGKPDSFLPFDAGTSTILKYIASVVPRVKGGVSLESLGFGFDLDASASLKSIYYRNHQPNETIRSAVMQDLATFHTIFRWADIEKLAPADVVSFIAGGKLVADLEMSWSNVFSQSISGLNGLFKLPVTLDLSLTPTLTVNFAVEVKDQYCFVIRKLNATEVAVMVNKTKSRSTAGGVGATIKVGFSNPAKASEDLAVIGNSIIKTVTGKSSGEIDKAIQNLVSKTANTQDLKVIAQVADLIGLTNAKDVPELLAEQWENLKTEIQKRIGKLGELNAEMSFSFQYKRVKENKELLSFVMPLASLKGYHKQLLQFKLGNILEKLRKGDPDDVKSYLNEEKLSFQKTWGFGLTVLGKDWIKGKSKSTNAESVLTDLYGKQQVNLERSRGYEWKIGNSGRWMTEVVAKMNNYSATTTPMFSETDLGIALGLAVEENKVTEKELINHFDQGVIWGAIAQADVSALLKKYLPMLKGKRATFESKLYVGEQALRMIILQAGHHQWNDINMKMMGKAMGAAMMYDSHALRDTVAVREDAYGTVWFNYFKNPSADPREIAYKVLSKRKEKGAPGLATMERKAKNETPGKLFADVLTMNSDLLIATRSFFSGVGQYYHAIRYNTPLRPTFDQAFRHWERFLEKSFYVKALGRFMLLYYEGNNSSNPTEIQPAFTITYNDENGEEQVVNIGKI